MKLNRYYLISYQSPYACKIMLLTFVAAILCALLGIFCLKKEKRKYFLGTLFTLYWILVILSMTMFGRIRTEAPQMQLQLFWCIKKAWVERNAMNWYFLIGNIALFIPLGVILPCFFNFTRSWGKCLLIGFQVSLIVEILQLVLHLGLFELDDLVNNTFGCMLGYSLYIICQWIRRKKSITLWDKALAAATWIFTTGFFIVAVLIGQPVFNWLLE